MTTVVNHPLAQERLTTLRDQTTTNAHFRSALHDLSRFVVYEALRGWSTELRTVTTPLADVHGVAMSNLPLIVPVMRAGLGMLDAALELLPDATVGFVGLRRDETTLETAAYVNTVPDDLLGCPVLVLDPMLATGGSLLHAVSLLIEANVGHITVASVLAAPEGIATVVGAQHDLTIVTAAIDSHLNENAYIVPGLGDAGDRQFGRME